MLARNVIADHAMELIKKSKSLKPNEKGLIIVDSYSDVEDKLIKNKYPPALAEKGIDHYLEKEFDKALPLLTQASRLGSLKRKLI